MRKIMLTGGKFAQVDDADYEWLNQWNWFAYKRRETFYAARSTWINGKSILIHMHRVIVGAQKGSQVDHQNLDGLNNQRGNLRFTTASQNQANRHAPNNNTSGYKGVYWDKSKNKWCAQIKVKGNKIRLGRYINIKIAALAYNNAAIKYFGEFANLNNIIY